ncbi:GNAT family N-acetyltransferase [Haloplasma contractile]|uniref:Ribosomal-protein-alanine acetyltransferase n=1 Tax=Haloplasma contractile SSD-17B TaxID=1033810 RepID=F7Q1F4_9MOLU|nr:GNAT family protein [Haloplasma contractile]ERJ12873.1 Ribosomal-protein-alanine acetyltransferase [Haloplasma contractile SSD-17B]
MNYPIAALPQLETDRIILREISQDDALGMFNYAKRENVGPKAGWPPHEQIEQTSEIIKNMQESMLTETNIGVWAIVHKDDQKMIGTVGLHRLDQKKECVELGYVLSPDYCGQGLMKEACTTLIRWCFEDLQLYRLECGHFEFNTQSKRVIEKLGFRFEGISRKKVVLLDGSRCDLYNYSILKPEYNSKKLPW